MGHVRGAPCHPQTQGKIERWHQTLKNRILLENYYLPGDLEAKIDTFVDHYNHRRYHHLFVHDGDGGAQSRGCLSPNRWDGKPKYHCDFPCLSHSLKRGADSTQGDNVNE